MAIVNVSLKNVITGSNQKYFVLDILDANGTPIKTHTYIANIEADDDLENTINGGKGMIPSQFSNRCNLIDSKNNIIIRNMYDIVSDSENFKSRSYSYANKADAIGNNISDYSDLHISYNYKTVDIVEFNDSMYVLTDKLSSCTYNTIKDITKDPNSNAYIESTTYINNPIYTAIFPPVEDLIDAAKDSNKNEFNQTYVPAHYINGMPYNHIIEYPTSVYPLFNESTILGNTVIMKNHLGYDYDQHSITDNIITFNELRSYKRLIPAGDSLYLVYSNDTSATTTAINNDDKLVDIDIESINPVDESITITDFTKNDNTKLNYATGNIEKVETLHSINRYDSSNKYKSNLYSIEISNLGLNELSKDESLKHTVNNIKKSISNGIRKLCKNVHPGNTQLFSIFFTGK